MMKILLVVLALLLTSTTYAQGDTYEINQITHGKWNPYLKDYDWKDWTPVSNVTLVMKDNKLSVYKGTAKYTTIVVGDKVDYITDDETTIRVGWFMTDNEGKRGVVKLVSHRESNKYQIYVLYKDIAYVYSWTLTQMDNKLNQ